MTNYVLVFVASLQQNPYLLIGYVDIKVQVIVVAPCGRDSSLKLQGHRTLRPQTEEMLIKWTKS